MTEVLLKKCKKAVELVLNTSKKTRIRVVSHYDADGITSAGIICKALYRAGFDFHASLMRNPFDKGLERVKAENNEFIIFSDMGSGQIETLEEFNCDIVIIDHHQVLKPKTNKNIVQINANLCGIDGNYEACGASLCYSFAKAMNSENLDLSTLALVGVMGDKQYIGGVRGYNKSVLDEAVENGFLKKFVGLKLYGVSLYDALFYSIDPYITGVSGSKEGINNLFKKLNIEGESKVDDLDDNLQRKLNSFLLFKLIKKGCQKNILDTVIRDRYWSDLFNCELERLADLLDACGKGGNRGLGLALCLGDKNSFNDALSLEKEYKHKIIDELLKLDCDGVSEKNSFRYFYSNDSSLGGVIGGIATNFILDDKKPLLSLVCKDDEVHVSSRGNQRLVKDGLDLGCAMKEASLKLGGHGGGHKIAAGATINLDKQKDFLDIVDNIISNQMK